MAKPAGFSETAEPFAHTSISPEGRIVLPAALREAAGIKKGDRLTLRVRNGKIEIETLEAQVRRAQEIAAKYHRPGESLVDEFLAEKRQVWGEEE